jgi:hypothetical protein
MRCASFLVVSNPPNYHGFQHWLISLAPPKLRRKAAAVRELVNCRRHANLLLNEQILDIPIPRLVSRRPIWTMKEYSMTALFNISGAGTDYWLAALPVNGLVVMNGCSSTGSVSLRADVHL